MKYVALLIIAVISFAISRLMFTFVNDPEGPNLLIVTALAVVIVVPLYLVYLLVAKKRKTS